MVGKFTYHAPDAEPLDFALSQGVYNVFILIAAMGILSSVLLTLSLCEFKSTLKNLTLGVSVLTNILFYLFIVLLFVVNKNPIFIALFLWFFCAVACVLLLIKEVGAGLHGALPAGHDGSPGGGQGGGKGGTGTKKVSIRVGDSKSLRLNNVPWDDSVTWSSSNEAVATVEGQDRH